MSNRPRLLPLGTGSFARLKEYTNAATGTLITGVLNGTVDLYNDESGALLTTVALSESDVFSGTYLALIPFDLAGLSEGLRVRFVFNIDGGTGLEHRKSMRAVCRTLSDEGT